MLIWPQTTTYLLMHHALRTSKTRFTKIRPCFTKENTSELVKKMIFNLKELNYQLMCHTNSFTKDIKTISTKINTKILGDLHNSYFLIYVIVHALYKGVFV
jgi:hypothetical protein